MKHKLESRLPGEISVTSDIGRNNTLMAESEEELKSFLMKVKEESEKAGLKLYIWKTEIMATSPITSWEIDGETWVIIMTFIYSLLHAKHSSKCFVGIKLFTSFGAEAVTVLFTNEETEAQRG